LSYLRERFRTKLAKQITATEVEKFQEWLGKQIAPVTLRERITLLNACWDWAIQRKWLHQNPWSEIKIRVPRRQKPDPFTEAEIKAIVTEVRSNPLYSHYADYVEFMLGTGCRIGEAIALRWKHLNADCSMVHFIESCYRGRFKGLKEDERFVGLTEHLQKMLLVRRPQPIPKDALVFTAPLAL
jgi:integrase